MRNSEDQIQQLRSELARTQDLVERLANIVDLTGDVEKLQGLLHGNGREGVLVRLARLEETVEAHERHSAASGAVQLEAVRGYWKWALLVSPGLLALVSQIVSHFLK